MKNKIISFILCLSLILITIISIIDFWCFNKAFYQNEYKTLNTAEDIGMSQEDLNKTTDVLLDYLKDYDKTLDINVNVLGINREVFNDKEKAHMIDVRNLYQNVLKVRTIGIIIYVITFVLLCFNSGLKEIKKQYLKALIVFLFIFGLIGIFCLIDFDGFWLNFHYLFFPQNDLWLLDPRTDILIMMVPSKFFFDLCISIVLSILITLVGYYFIIKLLDKRLK